MDTLQRRTGAEFVAALPDEGPWSFAVFGGVLIALSQRSGAYYERDGKLEPVLVADDRPVNP